MRNWEARDQFEIFGSFHSDNDQFVVQPSSDHVQGHVVSKIANETPEFDSTPPRDYADKTRLMGPTASQHLRFRRQTKKYEIELLSVVDYKSYMFWYNLTAGSSDRHTDTVANIMEYMTYMVSAMDVRYKSISEEPFTISVLNSGVFIADTPEASPWSVTKVTDGRLPSDAGLTAFTEWVQSQTGLPKHDHAMGFTGYDVSGMTSGADSSGMAGLRVLCTKDSTSLVEDRFNFITMTTAAHELGHSLGATHDGTGNTCPSADNYIMASANNIVLDPVISGHLWKFSRCSVDAFIDYLDSMDRAGNNCLLSTAPHSKAAVTSRPMAQVYTPDATCVNRFGSGSFVCRSIQDYSALCRSMFCNQPNTTQCYAVIPAEGTTCGRGKWCDQGMCVTSSIAPTDVSDNCPIGDRPGLFESTGMTCAEYIESNPGNCYINYTRTSCCESCNKKEKQNPDCRYGDRGTFCSGIQRFSCYSNEHYCCETCPKLKNTSLPGCEYGDKLTGCEKTYCPFYSDQDRAGCCETCYDPSRPTTPVTTTVATTTITTTLKPTPAPTTSTKATPPTTTTPSTTPLTTPPTTPPTTTLPPTTTSLVTPSQATNTPTATKATSTGTHSSSTQQHTTEQVTSVMTSEVTPERTPVETTTTTETKTNHSPNALGQDIVPVAIPIAIGTAVFIVVIVIVCCVVRRVRRIRRQEKLAVKDDSYDNIGFTPRQHSTQEASEDNFFRPHSDASRVSSVANGSLLYADGYMMPAPSVISEMSVQYTAPNKAGFLATLKNATLLRGNSPGSMKPPLPDVSKRASRPVHYKRAAGSLTGTLTNQSRPGSGEASAPVPGFSGEVKQSDSDTYDSIGDVLNNIPRDRRPTLPENHPCNLNEMIKKFDQIQSSDERSKSLSHIEHKSTRAGTSSLPSHLSGMGYNEYNMPASPTSTAAPTPSPRNKTAPSHSLPPPPTQYDNNAYCNDPEYDEADPPPRTGSQNSLDSHYSGSIFEHPESVFNDSYLISQQFERPKTRSATTEQSAENNGMPSIGKSDPESVSLPPNRPVPRRQSSIELPERNTVNGLPLKQTLKKTSDNHGYGRDDNVTDRHSSEIRDDIMSPLPPNKPVPRRQTSRDKSNASSPLSAKENTDIASKLPPKKPVPRRLSGEHSNISSHSSNVMTSETSNILPSHPMRPVPRRQTSSDNATIASSPSDQKATETFGTSALVPPSRPTPRRQSSSESSGTAATASVTTPTQPEGIPDGPLKAMPKVPIRPVPMPHSSSENSSNSEPVLTKLSNQTPQSQTIAQTPSLRSDGAGVKSPLAKTPLRPPNEVVPRGQPLSETSNQIRYEESGGTYPTLASSSGLQSSATEGSPSESNTAAYPPRRPLPRRQSSYAPKSTQAMTINKPDIFQI